MLHFILGDGEAEKDLLGDFAKNPVKLGNDFKDSFKSVTKEIGLMDVEMTKVVRTMGASTYQSLGLKQNLNSSYQAVVDLGGKMADVTGQQDALFNVTGRNLISLKSQSEELFAAVSVTGLKAEELQESFYNAGMEGAHIAENVLKIVQVSNQLGVNAQAVSKVGTDNLDKLNRYGFTNGVEGLAKMAGKAAALRFDITETFELADDLMSPEKAIEIAGAIQRLGGAASSLTDPLKLMDLAQNNLPELQNELGKLAKQYTFFNEKTQSFEIMKGARNQLKAVADELQIDRAEFEKLAISSASLSKKMSEIKFPGFNIGNEDKEFLANIAQLETNAKGTKEYVVNYFDKDGLEQKKALSQINKNDLELIKQNNEAQKGETGEDPQKQLVKIAKDQLGAFGRLAAANEKIANTIPRTIAASQTGKAGLEKAANVSTSFAADVGSAFGPTSEFKKGMDKFGTDVTDISGGLAGLVTGDIPTIITALGAVTTSLFDASIAFGGNVLRGIIGGKVDETTIPDGFFTPKSESVTINDGFKTPTQIGDSLKTPNGTFDIYEKDYMLNATELPKVLQLSSESGMRKVLNEKMGDISSIISGALSNINVNGNKGNDQPQKQEVVHTINFKVSVDGQNNKLSNTLAEEIRKGQGKEVMEQIVSHFENTRTSGGMVTKKK